MLLKKHNMIKSIQTRILLIQIIAFLLGQSLVGQHSLGYPNKALINRIKLTNGFIALWPFNEKPGEDRKAIGDYIYALKESGEKVDRINEGPVSGYSIRLDGMNYLSLPHSQTEDLNIFGENKGVTVIAWIKWSGEQTGFIGGLWNEYQDGGKRQYGLFISLPYYNGKDQVCGHISKTGKPTPPFPYSMDYSASRQIVPKNEWCCAAFTFDGRYIKSYLNGEFESRDPELINNTIGFEGYPDGLVQSKNPYFFPDGIGNNGSDFTVGAVLLKSGMGNYFKGLIGGLAVFDRALTNAEIKQLVK